jgi:integrase
VSPVHDGQLPKVDPDHLPEGRCGLWHPHQLRHSAVTEIRKRFGIEASRVILGHEELRVTQIYADEDRNRDVESMRQIG